MNNEMQQKYLQLEMIKREIEQLNSQKQQVKQKIDEINETKKTVQALSKIEENNSIWPQIGAGVFIKAKVAEKDSFMVDSGASVFTTKSSSEVLELLEKQIEELKRADKEMDDYIEKYNESFQNLSNELRQNQQGE